MAYGISKSELITNEKQNGFYLQDCPDMLVARWELISCNIPLGNITGKPSDVYYKDKRVAIILF